MKKKTSEQTMTGTAACIAVGSAPSGIGSTVFTVICAAALIGYLGGPVAWCIIALFLIVFFRSLWRAKRQDDEDRRTAMLMQKLEQTSPDDRKP